MDSELPYVLQDPCLISYWCGSSPVDCESVGLKAKCDSHDRDLILMDSVELLAGWVDCVQVQSQDLCSEGKNPAKQQELCIFYAFGKIANTR